MVLSDDVFNPFAQLGFTGDLDAVLDVGDEDEGAHGGGQFLVFVLAGGLVLNEVERLLDLAHVVVVGRHLGQKGIGPDGFGRGLDHVADDDGVVVRAGGLEEELLEDRLVQVDQLSQLGVGGVAEENLHQRGQPNDDDPSQEPAYQGGPHLEGGGQAQQVGLHQTDGHDHEQAHQPGPKTGLDSGRAVAGDDDRTGGGDG